MLAYGSMLLFTLCFTVMYDNAEKFALKKYKNAILISACIPAALLSSIRFEVGTDYGEVYWMGYLGTAIVPDDPLIARSYVTICSFLNLFSESPILFFIVSSCLIIFSVFWFVKNINEKITFPILIFFIAGLFFDSMNVVRQYIAIAVWLFAFPFIKKRKLLPFLIISAIAIYIHPTAAVLTVFYVLYKIKLTPKRFGIIGAVCAAGVMLTYRFLPILLSYVPKYNAYAEIRPDPELAATAFAVIFTAAAIICCKRLEKHENIDFLLWALLLYDITVFSSYFLPQMGRVMLYFEIPVFLGLVPCIISVLPCSWKKISVPFIIVFCLSSTIYMNYFLDHSDVFPYKTVFEINDMGDYSGDLMDVLMHFRQDAALDR